MQKKIITTVVVSVVCLCGILRANLIQNSSFETCRAGYEPVDPGWGVKVKGLPSGTGSVDYWNITFASNWGEFYWYWASSGGFNAQDGSRFMNLTSGSGQTVFESVSQSFNVVAGVTYTVSYYERQRVAGAALKSEILLAAGSASGMLTQTANAGAAWTLFSYSFTPNTSTTATLKFSQAAWATGLNDGVFLDNVKVIPSSDQYVNLTEPTARAVFQRGKNNEAAVPIAGTYTGTVTRVEARVLVMPGFTGTPADWQTIADSPAGGTFNASLSVPAGGWYRIEVQAYNGDTAGPVAVVEKVGVGEVFITSGQSNSANYGSPALTPTHDTVSAWLGGGHSWRHAYDPQPYAGGTGGSTWSRLGNMLAEQFDVPIGFMSTGIGATRVDQWVPGAAYYPRLQAALAAAGPNGVRAFLWHQGESDSLASTSAATYAARLNSIIAQTRVDAGWNVPWGVALASYHPDSSAAQEAQVRAGQQSVIAGTAGVFQGADTDGFLGLGYLHDGVHFNDAGLSNHAGQWMQSIIKNLFLCDMNLDGNIDLNDFAVFASQWLLPGSAGGDFNNDSIVNTADLTILADKWLNER